MNKKSITTKTGDQGQSSLFSGERVPKNSARLDAYGDVDELTSLLGVARQHGVKTDVEKELLFVQKALWTVCAELATSSVGVKNLKQRVDSAFLAELEQRRESLEKRISPLKGFIVPANSLPAAYIDLARAVSRRVERKVVGLSQSGELNNDILLVWLNRLSDFLFLLARFEEGTPLYVKNIP